jgi:predicted transposase YdaD
MSKTAAAKIYDRGQKAGIAEGKAEGIAEGKTEGKAEGKAEGLAEGRTQIALILLEKNMDLKFISETTNLSIEQLMDLKAKHGK